MLGWNGTSPETGSIPASPGVESGAGANVPRGAPNIAFAGGGSSPFVSRAEAVDAIGSADLLAPAFHGIANELAIAGKKMFEGLFNANKGTKLDIVARLLCELMQEKERVLTVNATDFHIPWRMLYTHPDPKSELSSNGANFDPKGFWAISILSNTSLTTKI